MPSLGRLGYATPEAVGMNSHILKNINSIVQEAIDKKTVPGCQLIVARRGKIVYEKSVGWQTYDNKIAINDQSIYDLASVTKVAATLQTTMFLYEKGLLDIYTILKQRGRIAGLTVALVGDIRHSRVARSNIHGLITLVRSAITYK